MEIDIKYLSESFSTLTGLPVRLYEKEKQIFYYSTIDFIKDPIVLDLDNILSLNNKHIGYYLTKDFFYYGYINYNDLKFVIGPSREVRANSMIINNMAYELNLNKNELLSFKNAMSFLNPMPLNSLLQALITLNYVLNQEKILLKDLLIDYVPTAIDNTLDNDYDVHNTYDIEKRIIDIIKNGDIDSLISFSNESQSIRAGSLSNNYIRNLKNTFIVATTLSSRAAIESGIDINESLSMSDNYISNMELLSDPKLITTLEYKMIYDYTERVSKIKANNSLELKVNKYILSHLDESIKTSDIASYLYMSRTNLSKVFKDRVGITLHDYILKYKIEYSKELIKNGVNLSVISYNLGFASQSHFTNSFKKYTNITPNEYKSK